jgi:hypothetical protein
MGKAARAYAITETREKRGERMSNLFEETSLTGTPPATGTSSAQAGGHMLEILNGPTS